MKTINNAFDQSPNKKTKTETNKEERDRVLKVEGDHDNGGKKEDCNMSNDKDLLDVHNEISYSTNIEETKLTLKLYPRVLSHHVLDWGGCILLHTVCQRQPENFELIKLLVAQGGKYNVGGCDRARGGLLVRDCFDRTPLNVLVGNNAIATLRKLEQSEPPLIVPYDVVENRLFNSVHSAYHVDMVRYLLNVCPESVTAKYQYFFEGGLLIQNLCGKVTDTRLVLRVMAILIEEGLRQNVGGEYGIGGLFVSSRNELTAADLLVEKQNQSWDVLAPVLRDIIMDVPILHGAIMTKTISRSYSTHILGILNYVENSSTIRDSSGRLPIHVAADQGLIWKYMKDILHANILAATEKDPLSGLPVFALAAAGEYICLSSVYELVLLSVEDFA
jgi:hypothetical protein